MDLRAPGIAVGLAMLAGGCSDVLVADPVRVAEASRCVYDAERGGMSGSYLLEGSGDAHVVVWVVKRQPSSTPLLGSQGWLLRDGDYQQRQTYLVGVDRAPESADDVICRVEVDGGPTGG